MAVMKIGAVLRWPGGSFTIVFTLNIKVRW